MQQGEREVTIGLSGNPETEFVVDLVISWLHNGDQLFHEAEPQVAVLQNNPASGLETLLHGGHSFRFLPLAHRDGFERIFFLLFGKLFDVGGGVGTGGQQEEDRFLEGAALPDSVDGIGDRTCEFLA